MPPYLMKGMGFFDRNGVFKTLLYELLKVIKMHSIINLCKY